MGLFSGIGKIIKKVANVATGGLVGTAIDVIGGVVGRNDQQRANAQAQQAEADKFHNLRARAAAAGFNPLTALENGGLQNNFGMYQAPPLASIAMITNGVRGFSDEITGVAAKQRQSQQLQDDLTKVKIDALRLRPGALDTIAGSLPRLGSGHTSPALKEATVSKADHWLTPGRPVEVDPRVNTGGIMTIENALTGGPVHVYGDEVATDISEAIFQGIQAVPQIGFNWAKKGFQALGSTIDAANKRPASSWDDAEHRRMYPNDY